MRWRCCARMPSTGCACAGSTASTASAQGRPGQPSARASTPQSSGLSRRCPWMHSHAQLHSHRSDPHSKASTATGPAPQKPLGHALNSLQQLLSFKGTLRLGKALTARAEWCAALLQSKGVPLEAICIIRQCCCRHLWLRLQIENACTAQTVCLAFCMPLTIGLVMLLVWNVYLALQNKTTIEFHEGVTANIKVCNLAAPN